MSDCDLGREDWAPSDIGNEDLNLPQMCFYFPLDFVWASAPRFAFWHSTEAGRKDRERVFYDRNTGKELALSYDLEQVCERLVLGQFF
ncbi:MAG: hypothetical protein ABL995_16090 [Bryobacteraceae bacterium]